MSVPASSSGALTATAENPPAGTQSAIGINLQGGINLQAPPSIPVVSSAVSQHASGPLIRRNIVVGSVLIVAGLLAYAVEAYGVDYSLMVTLTGVVGVLSLVTISVNVFDLAKSSAKRYSPLNFVPSTGAFVICVAAVLSAFVPAARDDTFLPTLLAGAPLTVGSVLLIRALISRIWSDVDSLVSLVPGFPLEEKAIAEGEVFSITAGIIVPTDCRVGSGSCAVLERHLSPDAHFRVKDESDVVFAGSYVISGQASVQALTGSYDSCLKRLEQAVLPGLRWVEESLKRDHDHIVTPIVYVLLFCFVSSAIFWDERGAAGSTTLLAAGSILTVSLLLQVGEALYATRSRLVRAWAQRGFLINSAKAWTEIYNVRDVAFDPSRLASSTACRVKELNLMDDRISENAVCSCIASVVGRAEDSALLAIGDYCQRVVGAVETDRVVDLREYEGRGICGTVKGIEFSVGSEDFLVDRGILIQPTDSLIEEGSDDRIVLVAIGDDVIARFWVGYGQKELLTEEGLARWPKNLHGRLLDVSERELRSATLLVRGEESDALGRSHSPEVAFLQPNTLEVPPASIVCLTTHLELIPALVRECRRHVHEVLRARAWILFAAFVSVCLVFAGFVTPAVALALVPVIAVCIFI